MRARWDSAPISRYDRNLPRPHAYDPRHHSGAGDSPFGASTCGSDRGSIGTDRRYPRLQGSEMTLGALNRQMRELEDRFTELSTQLGERKGDGSAFTDEQTKQIKALIEERAALF